MKKYPHTIKKTILKIGVVIMATVTLTSLFGCSQKDDVAGTVKKNLEAKYHEKFVISKVYGGSLVPTNVFADSHKLICYPENNPNLKFKAELSPNGVFYDAYVSANVNVNVEKLISDALQKEFPDVIVKSVAIGPYLDSSKKNISIEEFFNEQKAGFNIHTVIQTDIANASKIYDATLAAIKAVKNFDACIYFYFVNQSDLIQCKNLLKQNIEIDPKQIKDVANSEKHARFNYSEESVNKTKEIFIQELEKGED